MYNYRMKPKIKKYGYCEYKSNEDKHWNIQLQKSWNENGKKIIDAISRKYATRYQLKQLDKRKNTPN